MKKILCGFFACIAASISVPGWADAPTREYKLELARSSVRAVLAEFSRQTGLQTGFYPDSPAEEKIMVGPLKGHYTAEAALSELLASSGLSFMQDNERTITVIAPDATRPSRRSATTVSSEDDETQNKPAFVHLVDRRYGDEWNGNTRAKLAATNELSNATEIERQSATEEHAKAKAGVLAEVIVTGTNIRGLENKTVPVTILDKAYIESTGLSTTTKLMESLPQNFALTNQSTTPGLPGVASPTMQGSSINLRGLGEGTTLVLLNGRRIAPGFRSTAIDISALPLSAIDRVEIVTDGASALYGSDAVGGVVNFVLRDDFSGAQTTLRSGWADGDVNEYRLSQTFGDAWASGNALLSLQYYKRDILLAGDRDFVPTNSLIGSLAPEDKNYSAMFAGRQEISDSVEVFSTALYTKRKSYNLDGATTANQDSILDNPQISASAGLDWHVGGDWQIEAAGNYSRNNANQLGTRKTIELDSAAEVRQIQAKADGSLLGLPGGALRMAVGVEWRSESYRDESIRLPSGTVAARTDSDRTVRSAFGEIYVPVVGATNALPMVRSLDLSIAGRFDEYSNTGSSFDPQFGMMWEPVTGLRFRSSYGTSYVIPKLADFSATGNLTQAYVIQVPDPGSTTRTSRQMILRGIDVASLSPQESRSLSVGIEFTPEALRALRLSLNYYNINYKDRVSSLPAVSSILLGNPAAYGSLIAREPSIDLINQGIASGRQGQGFFVCSPVCVPEGSLAPESIDVIVDQRRRNLSEVKTRGFDISAQYGVQYLGNSFQFVLSSTYIDELSQRVTSSSAQVDSVDTVYNPPHWRARGSVGWVHDGWGANLFVNYTDSYEDIRVPASHKSVDSYTTVDARLAYDFSVPGRDGLRSGLSISLSAQNLFDQDPPQLALLSPGLEVGFDPTNANPMGRLLAIEINKVW